MTTLQLVEVGVSLQSCLGTSPHTSLGEQHVVQKRINNILKTSMGEEHVKSFLTTSMRGQLVVKMFLKNPG